MALYGNNLWLAEQNTKISALSHVLSYRVTLTAANTTQTITIPSAITNPAQATFPGVAPTGLPQQGRRLFVTHLVVRDANGNLSGAGASAGGTVVLNDATQGQPVATVTLPASATVSPYVMQAATTGTTVINPNDTLSITYTAPTGATATGTGFTVDVMGYWQQGI